LSQIVAQAEMKLRGRLGNQPNLKMARNSDRKNRRSLFAESAYEHARRSSSYQDSNHQDDEDYNLLYYEDATTNTIDQSQPNAIVHAEFQPLAGASIVIIANTSKRDKVTNARTLKLMEERESIGCAVESLGGKWVPTLEAGNGNITHAIWIASEEDDHMHNHQFLSHLSNETLIKLNNCLAMDIPVVCPNWLTQVGQLLPGLHWSEIDVEKYIPRTIKLFYDTNSNKRDCSASQNHPLGTASNQSRRDTSESLSASIGETYQTLIDENPDVVEAEALKRAMELSMLDFAIVHHFPTKKISHQKEPPKKESPHEILNVGEHASRTELKNAYRRRALETHPDKGGKPGEFEAVARAYRILLNAANNNGLDVSFSRDDEDIVLKSTAHWDTELKEHRNLVKELYQNHGQDIDDNLQRQNYAIEQLGLCKKEAGSLTYNEKHELIRNSCFYLSLASSYLSGIGALDVWDKSPGDIDDPDNSLLREADDALIKETALQLKRVIEAAVLSAHPEWAAKGMVGEEVQAFSDFLVYILESQTIISDWSVVIFDTSSGFVDIYKGQNYKDEEEGTVSASNTLTLRFVPGHYQPLVAATPDSTRPTLKQVVSALDECGVIYVVTDGAAPEERTT